LPFPSFLFPLADDDDDATTTGDLAWYKMPIPVWETGSPPAGPLMPNSHKRRASRSDLKNNKMKSRERIKGYMRIHVGTCTSRFWKVNTRFKMKSKKEIGIQREREKRVVIQ
jgi:hypothetical protein